MSSTTPQASVVHEAYQLGGCDESRQQQQQLVRELVQLRCSEVGTSLGGSGGSSSSSNSSSSSTSNLWLNTRLVRLIHHMSFNTLQRHTQLKAPPSTPHPPHTHTMPCPPLPCSTVAGPPPPPPHTHTPCHAIPCPAAQLPWPPLPPSALPCPCPAAQLPCPPMPCPAPALQLHCRAACGAPPAQQHRSSPGHLLTAQVRGTT